MAHCKTVTVCGRRRKLCFGKNGKIRSNTSAGGGGGRKSSHRKSSSKGGAFVSMSECTKRNGRLKKGFKFAKGGRCKRAAR